MAQLCSVPHATWDTGSLRPASGRGSECGLSRPSCAVLPPPQSACSVSPPCWPYSPWPQVNNRPSAVAATVTSAQEFQRPSQCHRQLESPTPFGVPTEPRHTVNSDAVVRASRDRLDLDRDRLDERFDATRHQQISRVAMAQLTEHSEALLHAPSNE